MYRKSMATMILVFIIMFVGACGEAVSVDGSIPQVPGDGGDGGTNSLMLSWTAPTTNEDGTPLNDLAGYRLYYGTQPGNYSHVVDIGKYTTVELSELASDTYYMSVTAYDYFGNESEYSKEINYSFN